MADFWTEHLAYYELMGLVYLRPHGVGDADDEVKVGAIDDIDSCPEPYVAEFKSLQQDVASSRRYADECRAEAIATYYRRMDARGW